jgi:hypothetical protein
VRALSVVIRALLVPLHVALVWLQRLELALTRPRYTIAGACRSNGLCCESLLLVEAPFLTWPLLRGLTRFWMQRVYPFAITDNAIEDPDSGEVYRILRCRNLVDRRCAEYALRPRVCRGWPLPTDEAPVLLHGCGYRALDRQRGDDVDVSRRKGREPSAARSDLALGWPRRRARTR